MVVMSDGVISRTDSGWRTVALCPLYYPWSNHTTTVDKSFETKCTTKTWHDTRWKYPFPVVAFAVSLHSQLLCYIYSVCRVYSVTLDLV